MTQEELSRALRALDAPYLIDSEGRPSLFGAEFPAMTGDGRRVTVTQLDPALVAGLVDVDAFLQVFRERQHRAARGAAGVIGAGVTPGGAVFVVHASARTGESLAERLRREGTIPSAELRSIAVQVAARLEQEHSASLVHGLLFPETVHVGPGGEVSLAWSGLLPALRAGGLTVDEIARRLRCAGYMAPELLGGAPENVATDIYATGATLYEAMTGRPPFGGRTTATVMAAVLADDVAPRPAQASDALMSSVLRAIEREPADRWNDAQQLHAALVATSLPIHGARSLIAHRGKAALVCLLTLGVGALVLWWWMFH